MRYLIFLLGIIPCALQAQIEPLKSCGTPDAKLVHLLEEHAQATAASGNSGGTLLVKIYAFKGGPLISFPYTITRLRSAFDNANELFKGSGIQFELCGDPVFVDSLFYNGRGFRDWERENVDPRIISIYSGVSSSFSCANASNIGGGTLSSMVISCNHNGYPIAHEFGHLLGLNHTFVIGPGEQL